MAVITKESLPVDEINQSISRIVSNTKRQSMQNMKRIAAASKMSADEEEKEYEIERQFQNYYANLESMLASTNQTQNYYVEGYGQGLTEGTKSGFEEGLKIGKEQGQQEFLLKLLSKAALSVVGATAMKTLLSIMGLNQYIPFLDSLYPPDETKPGQKPGPGGGKPPAGVNVVDTGLRDYKGRPVRFNSGPAAAFKDMVAAARKEGVDLGPVISSSYRTPSENQRVGGAPNSAHLYGESFDINWYAKGADWLKNNAENFGFRYNPYSGESTHFDWTGDYTPSNQQSKAAPEPKGAAGLEPPDSTMIASAEPAKTLSPMGFEPSESKDSILAALTPPPMPDFSMITTQPVSRPKDFEYLKESPEEVAESSIYIQPVIIST